jgi:DNA primase large subunit
VLLFVCSSPFKHFEREFLRQKLRQYGRSEEETREIMEYSDGNNYQIACQRYFEVSHKTEEIVPINHPNQYFEQSQRILGVGKAKESGRGPNIKIEHVKLEITH